MHGLPIPNTSLWRLPLFELCKLPNLTHSLGLCTSCNDEIPQRTLIVVWVQAFLALALPSSLLGCFGDFLYQNCACFSSELWFNLLVQHDCAGCSSELSRRPGRHKPCLRSHTSQAEPFRRTFLHIIDLAFDIVDLPLLYC